jgi:hypothetical protein
MSIQGFPFPKQNLFLFFPLYTHLVLHKILGGSIVETTTVKGNQEIRLIEEWNFPHKDDKHLSLILAQNDKGEFVTWEYNKDRDSLFWGNYFDDMESAKKDFIERQERIK